LEKQQTNRAASRPAASGSRKNRLFGVFVLCLLLGVSLAVSSALLGGSLGRFSQKENNVIPLLPPKSTPLASGGGNTVYSAPEAEAPTTAQYQGNLEVFDNQKVWGSETQVDLFRNSYGQTVVSGDGEKVIAPGTSNFYSFALKNNGNIPLDYSVSLSVDTYEADQSAASAIPLEWRLLSGDGTAVTDWQGYNGRSQTLKQSTLAVRHQDGYTIEWRWVFERGADTLDTDMGDLAAVLPLGVKATITVYAEQSAGWQEEKPTGPWWLPKTGDSFNLPLYLAVLAVSALGLLVLLAAARHKNKRSGGGKG